MRLCFILILVSFLNAQDLNIQSPNLTPVATTPAFIECSKLGQAECGGTCKSAYGGEGKCTWGSGVTTGEYCYCKSIEEPSLSCSCPGTATEHPMCDRYCIPPNCIGSCYKGQKAGSNCHCSSICSESRRKEGFVYYHYHSCDCQEGTCVVNEETSTEPIEPVQKSIDGF